MAEEQKVLDAEPVEVTETVPTKEPTGKLLKYENGSIALTSMADAIAWADSVIRSGFAPLGFIRASQVIVAAQMGKELGLGPAASLRALYVPKSGRPALYAESAHALVLSRGLLEDFRHEIHGEGDERTATYHVKRRGMPWKSASFTMADAKRAGLLKADSGWAKYPDRMLLARARAYALHEVFPDVLLGILVEGDGVDEETPEQTSTPVTVPPPAAAEPDPLLEG